MHKFLRKYIFIFDYFPRIFIRETRKISSQINFEKELTKNIKIPV